MKISIKKYKILTLMARGYTDKEIAIIMQISTRTVQAHISSILSILNAKNRVNAVFIYKHKHPGWRI